MLLSWQQAIFSQSVYQKKETRFKDFKADVYIPISTKEWGNSQNNAKLTLAPSVIAGTVQLTFYSHLVSCFFHSLKFIEKNITKINAHMFT